MYLIPKNIKVKREIFRGYGVKEIVLLGFSILIGFILSKFFGTGLVKVFLFSFFPILMFLLTLPMPTGNGNILGILIKMFRFMSSQKKYKKYS
ncbi:MAG: hypothetical protein ACI4OT_01620 [Bacilli bacterium]